MDKLAAYQKILFDLDKRGHVPLERDDASDAKLAHILLSTDKGNARDDYQNLAAAAIDAYYKERPITLCTLLRAQEEIEKSKEGRAFLTIDSSITAFACQTVAVASAVAGVYELAAVFFVAGAYKIYDAIRVARMSDDE